MKDIGLILGIRPDVIRASKIIKLLNQSTDIDFDFIRRLQRHIENIARITESSIDEEVMANTMGYIWRSKNPAPSIDDLWDSFGVD